MKFILCISGLVICHRDNTLCHKNLKEKLMISLYKWSALFFACILYHRKTPTNPTQLVECRHQEVAESFKVVTIIITSTVITLRLTQVNGPAPLPHLNNNRKILNCRESLLLGTLRMIVLLVWWLFDYFLIWEIFFVFFFGCDFKAFV